MSSKIFVGNISYHTTEESLRELFESTGGEVISARIITDRETGRSRGFGFVEYGSDADARTALDELNGRNVDGRPLRLDLAQERGSGGGSGRSY